ncbi:hypothetical protein LI951_04265 [Enterococcus sp. BWT-B8]|uniref:hypothetical protein n=1 Tax=Enterococcus sp. BWT-B8 TaxID=2885157 RepID=UPI001E63F998|nr:hypothetical protein [Enterococcus sp. BWT-B8]MCB5951272.1 hypothetical protein [Enterococcus sp. BWT-B8]
MKKCNLKLGVFVLVTIFLLGLSGCGNSSKDFYGYWSGEEEGLPIAYDIKITKDGVFDLGADNKIFEYNYVMRKDISEPTIEVTKEELAKGIPELKQTAGEAFLLFRLSENKDKLLMISALDGSPSTSTLYKTTKGESPLGKAEKSSKNWLFLLIGLAVAGYVVKQRKTGKKA